MRSRLPSVDAVGSVLRAGRLACCIIFATGILLGVVTGTQCTGSAQASQDSRRQTSPAVGEAPSDPPANPAPEQVQESPQVSEKNDNNEPELATQDRAATFQVRVNLVEVRVVVRDAQGHAVKDLTKEDFQLLDDGKPQVITKFFPEEAGSKPAIQYEPGAAAPATTQPSPKITSLPERYIAYLFDDVHLPFGALANACTAAERQLQALLPTDRVAIYTTSGQTQVDFTDDRVALRDTLKRLLPRAGSNSFGPQCPHMTYYMADMIENRGDTQALDAATFDALDCAFQGKINYGAAAQNMARNAARSVLRRGDYDGRSVLDALWRVVRRLALMPGQRTILLVSPGFLNINQLQEQSRIVERALHSSVVIDTLDARGLYTPGDDASKNLSPTRSDLRWGSVDSYTVDGIYRHYGELEKTAQADVLRGLPVDTGGTFFNNSNDLGIGFAAATPEYSYLLGFSPPNLKPDGRFHNLKLTVAGKGFSIQARKGYYAPKQATNAAEQVRREVEEAVFSQEEWHDIPVQLHTEFFKSNDEDAKLSVLVRVDARRLHFRKVDGRNRNDVTVISALFDHNGKFISGSEKVLQMRLKDETLGSKVVSGLTLRTSFQVKPGSYQVRLVVCDDNGRMAAQNDAVEIP